jgi:hypothetical protein
MFSALRAMNRHARRTNLMTTANKRIRMPECPACSHKLGYLLPGYARVYRCAKCEAIHGSCYLGDSYTLVQPYMIDKEPHNGQIRYYDLDCLGSAGVRRRHGWYDPETRLIVQVG